MWGVVMSGPGHIQCDYLPPISHGSRLQVLRCGEGASKFVTVELPPAGHRMTKRVAICFLIIALMSSIPVIGLWYFLIYKNMIPGPAADVPVAHPHAMAGGAPAWYPWMVLVSLAFISAIFLFAAFTFLIEALHVMFGRTRLTVSTEGIEIERLLRGVHTRFGERFIEQDEITDCQFLPDDGSVPGSIRLTVIHHPVDLAEEVGDDDRRWIAGAMGVILGDRCLPLDRFRC